MDMLDRDMEDMDIMAKAIIVAITRFLLMISCVMWI